MWLCETGLVAISLSVGSNYVSCGGPPTPSGDRRARHLTGSGVLASTAVGSDRHDFLASLDAEDSAALVALGTSRTFERGQALFNEGQLADRVLVLRSGMVKVTSSTSSGREVVLAFRGPGELVGDLAALDGEPRSATIRAVEPVEALTVPATAFRALLHERPAVTLVLLTMLGRRLRDADAKRIEFSTYTTIQRVAVRLVELGERFGLQDASGAVRIALPLSQEELAGATGSSIESVGRALQTMRALNCVETRRREIWILDLPTLTSLRADA
jgi:CRP-like cAMP-binding protein